MQEGQPMSPTSWRGQVYRALQAIDCLGHSQYEAKQVPGWQAGQPVHGLSSCGYKKPGVRPSHYIHKLAA